MNKRIYLNDDEYLLLLKRGRENLNSIVKIEAYDSDDVGNKYNESNVGLCNEELTTIETAMWPEDFPLRKSHKYRGEDHKCPLDTRPHGESLSSGCFYKCRIFKSRKYGKVTIDEIKKMYDEEISYLENRRKNNG